jgi:hypothetical protein
MVTHGFRHPTNAPAKNHNCNANMSAEKRSEIARKAAKERWKAK